MKCDMCKEPATKYAAWMNDTRRVLHPVCERHADEIHAQMSQTLDLAGAYISLSITDIPDEHRI